MRLPVGIAADWLGKRKPFLVLGFVLSGLGAYLMATSNSAGIDRIVSVSRPMTWSTTPP